MEESRYATPENSTAATAAEYTRFAGRSVPAHHGNPATEYAALKAGAAAIYRPQGVLRLAGRDPVGMLDAILTNKVPGGGNLGVYALLLSQKGRIQADLRVVRGGEEVLILTEPEGAEAAKEILGRYAPFSRVKLEELEDWSVLGLYGPRAGELLGSPELAEHEAAGITLGDETMPAIGVALPVPGYDLIGPAESLQISHDYLLDRGAAPAGSYAYETARVEAGTPRFGADMTPENFPAEAGVLDRAVSFTKGCYPGQETVARMHYRGHPNRTLHRLKIEGPPPPTGTPLLQNEKPVGNLTSVAPLQVAGETLALGYLHRKANLEAPLIAANATVALSPPV
ncbi:MAG: YgfZ/GcvT domain-containing protein [Rubrobacteraceae bacterium]